MHSMVTKLAKRAQEAGVDLEKLFKEPQRRPDSAEEWLLLRKAWSLERNGQSAFSRARVRDGSQLLYPDDPIKDLADWLWRFARRLNQPRYEPAFRDVMEAIKPIG